MNTTFKSHSTNIWFWRARYYNSLRNKVIARMSERHPPVVQSEIPSFALHVEDIECEYAAKAQRLYDMAEYAESPMLASALRHEAKRYALITA
jgi:hypothetical protein